MENYILYKIVKKNLLLVIALVFVFGIFNNKGIAQETVFADDFESGTLSQWTDTGEITRIKVLQQALLIMEAML